MKWNFLLLVFFLTPLFLSGCRRDEGTEASEEEIDMSIQITSTAFHEGEAIPKQYTCDGENISPPLSWTGVPSGTQSLALIAEDPDAPSGAFVHWLVYNLPADLASVPEGAAITGAERGSGVQGTNGFRKVGYNGPCPPKGKPHRYYFKLYALDAKLNLKEGASKADVEKAMKGHILAWGQIMGKYGR